MRHAIVVTGGGAGSGNSQSIVKGPLPGWSAPAPGGPVASPELVRARPRAAPRAAPVLRPWTVPALAVDPAELADPAEEARYGASVAHLRALVELADDLAARGRVLPTLVREAGA